MDELVTQIDALIEATQAAQDKAANYGATWYALARARRELTEAREHAANGN
jgi:hypothetical protein